MEKSRFSRLTGVIYLVGALFGLVISLGGLLVLWTTRDDVTASILDTFELTGRGLTATEGTIEVMGRSLDQASTNLALMRDILNDVSKTLEESDGLILSTAGLMGGEMVGFVEETQDSLRSVQDSAQAMDTVLRLISRVPFLGVRYNPEQPLQDSVAEVVVSLDPLPASFTEIGRGLETSAANLATTRADITRLAGQVDEIDESISRANEQVQEYRLILSDLRERYEEIERRLPLTLNLIYIGLTLLLVWILMTQIGMLVHGLEMLGWV